MLPPRSTRSKGIKAEDGFLAPLRSAFANQLRRPDFKKPLFGKKNKLYLEPSLPFSKNHPATLLSEHCFRP
jgi:hypothetical protein